MSVRKLRDTFHGTVIWCGGFTKSTAQVALGTGRTDLIGFGRPFIGNPDLVARFRNDWPVVEADHSTFYTRNGEKGYADFPYFQSSSLQDVVAGVDIGNRGRGQTRR
jgi:N-ethylmaleimide reductase